MQTFDPLWVPVLTHYDHDTNLDLERTISHWCHLRPNVRQYLVAGTTGDGWNMSDNTLMSWLNLLSDPIAVDTCDRVLIGAFAATTDAVIERAHRIEAHINEHPLAADFVGLTICTPVDAQADQRAIADHIRAILAATNSPVAVYQLPQVTGCEIAPETFAKLAQENPRIMLFKDTSGTDRVVNQAQPVGTVHYLRGAEGNYHQHLKPQGLYDGYLLSTANGFAKQLRTIINAIEMGDTTQAGLLGTQLTQLVNVLFSDADDRQIANPFANVNRAVDHIFAYGRDWGDAALPMLANGRCLDREFLSGVTLRLKQAGLVIENNYL